MSQKQSWRCPPPARDTVVSEFTAVRAEYAHLLLRGHFRIFGDYDITKKKTIIRVDNQRDAQRERAY